MIFKYSVKTNNIFLSFLRKQPSRGQLSLYEIQFEKKNKIRSGHTNEWAFVFDWKIPGAGGRGEFESNRWNTVGGCLRCLEKLAPPFRLRRTFGQPFISPPAERLFLVIFRTMLQIPIPPTRRFQIFISLKYSRGDDEPFLPSTLTTYTGKEIDFHPATAWLCSRWNFRGI